MKSKEANIMEEKIVYTRRIANQLIRMGFPVVRVEQNPKKPEFDCWVFKITPDFKVAFSNVANR